MYSPKIREDLIPLLYRIRKWRRKSMTEILDEIVRPEIERLHDEVIKEEGAFYDFDDLLSKEG